MKQDKPINHTVALRMRQGGATAAACARQMLGGGLLRAVAPNLVRIAQFAVLVLLWKGFAAAGADLGGMSLAQLLTYTLMSFAFRQQMDIVSPATSSMWEGSVVGRYTRPMPVYLSYISETVGKWWLPYWGFFALPVVLVSPLLGIDPRPAGAGAAALFVVSLMLGAVVGFALDLILAAFAMRLKNAMWVVNRIREAMMSLLSGALIPLALFPRPVQVVLGLLPFGSLASAPLSIYVGTGNAGRLIALQAAWAVVLWPLAHIIYKKSEERMVSYGG